MVITASRVNGGIIIMWPVQEAVHSVSEPTSRYTGSQHWFITASNCFNWSYMRDWGSSTNSTPLLTIVPLVTHAYLSLSPPTLLDIYI